jgi:hypothetical protein
MTLVMVMPRGDDDDERDDEHHDEHNNEHDREHKGERHDEHEGEVREGDVGIDVAVAGTSTPGGRQVNCVGGLCVV